jgi:hypothetical protein
MNSDHIPPSSANRDDDDDAVAAQQIAVLREALCNSVTPEDFQAVARSIIELAKEGNVHAAKLVLTLVFGKPQSDPEPGSTKAVEWPYYTNIETSAASPSPNNQFGQPSPPTNSKRGSDRPR